MSSIHKANRPPRRPHHCQRGAVLLVMLVIVVMGAATFLVSSLSRSGLRIERDQNSSQLLAQTKDEVMGNILSGIGGQIPGNLLRPDAFASTESPYDYDGTAETGCFDASQPGSTPTPGLPLISSGTNMRCLGRLPWKDYGMSIGSPSENDPSGTMPWYAVSANLVDSINVTFNSDLLNSNPVHPWLTVRDMNGNVLSSRVAIAIIVPGVALPGQSRSSSPNLGGTNQYLDSITIPVGCTAPCVPGTYNNFDLDDDFIMGEERRWIPDPNNPASQIEDSSYQFNDKLIYINIDEMMPLIEKRVGNEIKKTLNTYYTAWGAFPFAAPFADPSTSSFTGQAATYNGLLPVGNIITNVATLSWDTITPPHYYINGIDSGTCYYSSGGASNSRLRCISSNITIPAGQTITFTGKLNGVGYGFWRPHDISTTNEFRVRNSSGNTVLATSMFDNVTIANSLNTDGSATITFSAQMKAGTATQRTLQRIEFRDIRPYATPTIPNWLFSAVAGGGVTCVPANDNCNNWHQVAYYAVSQDYAPGGNHTCTAPCLTVNGQNGGNSKQAVVVMMSGVLSGKSRSSSPLTLCPATGTTIAPNECISNYLELENATPANFIYENKTRSSTFNDQAIIVAP